MLGGLSYHSLAAHVFKALATLGLSVSSLNATGTVTAAELQVNGFSRKNLIINGDFDIWQRGTSFTSIATGTYFADRWRYQKSGSMVHDVSQSSDVPTVAEAGQLFTSSVLVDCTTADAVLSGGDVCYIEQKIEGYDWRAAAQRPTVLSFWVKATKVGTYSIAYRNSGEDRTYSATYTVNAADTWERKTINVLASPPGGTWNYTNGKGLSVNWLLAAAGIMASGPEGAWQSYGQFGAPQVNACDSAANNWRLTGVQLEVGSVATAFEMTPFAARLAACQRFYETEDSAASSVRAFCLSANYATTATLGVVNFKVEKRATPTLTGTAASGFSADNAAGSPQAGTARSLLRASKTGFEIDLSVASGLVAGNASVIRANASLTTFWAADAELT